MKNPAIPVPLPFIPGVEKGAGIVEEISDGVTEVKPGDRVAFVGKLGSYAEYITVPSSQLIPLPTEINPACRVCKSSIFIRKPSIYW